jgi:hypothetical protein
MKKLITIALLLISFSAYSQVYTKQPWYGLQVARVQADSVLTLPTGLGTLRQTENTRQLRYNSSDSSLYVWSGFNWLKSGGGGADSSIFATQYQIDTLQQTYDGVFADINGRLAGKVKYSDSTTTFATPTQLAAKLNIADTANIRARLIAGTNITLSGTYPNITINGSAAGWGLSGNSGTTAANFIGTTDSRSLRFRTNNVERLVIDSVGRIRPANNTLFSVDGTNGFTSYTSGSTFFTLANSSGIEGLLITQNGTGRFLRIKNSSRDIFFIPESGNILIGTGTDVTSSALTVESTTKGFLPPRMTTVQRDAISSPAAGLIVYNTTTNKHQGYNGSTWNDFY